MPRRDSVLNLVNRREVDFKVNSKLQKKLHVTSNLINRLGLEQTLTGHTGCVNCLEWDSKGRTLASASDDFHVIIWDPFMRKKLTTIQTGHHGNIFSVKFMPQTNENTVVTGAGDYEVRVHNVVCKELTRVCVCHGGRIKRIATAQDVPDIFWSAAEDGVIRQFDLRVPHTCRIEKNVLIDLKTYAGDYIEAKCLSVNPLRSDLIAVGANDPYIRIYDRRMIKIIKGINLNPTNSFSTEDNVPPGCVQYFVPGHVPSRKKCTDRELREYSATYVTFGPNGTDLLVNLGTEQIYLFDIMKKSKSLLVRHTNDNQEVSPPLKTYCDSDSFEKSTAVADVPKPYLPEHINVLKLAGNTLFEKEEYSSSIRIYNEAIGEYPKSSVMYSNRAAAFMKRDWCGDTYAALRDCVTALKFDPNNVKAFFRMSRCLYELSWFEEAQNCLNNFKIKFPSHSKSVACKALERDITRRLTKTEEGSEKDSTEFGEYVDVCSKESEWRESATDYNMRFYGHCNTTTDIKEANFFGSDGQFIVAGSDDGSIFIWDRQSTNNIRILKGDASIVNCLQPHPSYCMLATSGIEHVVRIWTPMPEDGNSNEHEVKEKDEVAQANQRRMKTDPFDVVLMNLGSRLQEDIDGNPSYCRTS
ncbi:hypothetical protein GE061_019334 [Apolygus lucorum]|uniref:Uncharacterized protein n=1 Tax=Apolygus lucorum TaxID=248454 RepID=A0A6A4JA98_APOLU|nr:hypothetical protein GE061_019334 [Apolygus lucorum]